MGSRPTKPSPTPTPPPVPVAAPSPSLRTIRAFRFLEESDQLCRVCDSWSENKHYNMYLFECGNLAHIECCVKYFCFGDKPHTCPVCSDVTGLTYVTDRVIDQYINNRNNDEKNNDPPLHVVPFRKNTSLPQLESLTCPCCDEPLSNTKYGPYYILECKHIYHVSCFLNHILHNYDNPSCLVCGTQVHIEDAYSDTFKACLAQYTYAASSP